MTTLDYIIICFTILGVIFIIASLIQIILLRSKISELWKQTANSEMQVKDAVITSIDENTKLQVYSIKVNRAYTYALCNPAAKFFNSIVDLAVPYDKYLTLMCSNRVSYQSVKYNAVGFLLLDSCAGTEELINDVQNERVRYLAINNALFDVRYSSSIEEKIKAILTKEKQFEKISRCAVLLLYNPFSSSNGNINDCSFTMKLFTGDTVRVQESNKCLYLQEILPLDAPSDSLLVHALAYKLPK